jgi:hypothetical protein
VEELSNGEKIQVEDRPQWSEIFVWTTKFKCQTKKMVGIPQLLDVWVDPWFYLISPTKP